VYFKLTDSEAGLFRPIVVMLLGDSVVFCLLASGEPSEDEPKAVDGFFGVVLRDSPLES
jgi:hypothetical protein